MEFCFLFLFAAYGVPASGLLTPEGCEESWVYFEDFCYSFITGQVHFDTAREICSTIKQATLVTLWKQREYTFVTEHLKKMLQADERAWVGIVPSQNRQTWLWVDGSQYDGPKYALPSPDPEVCGSITREGKLTFVDCDVTSPVFVCKKPVDMLYLPNTFNETDNLVDLDLETVVFERQWPPILNDTLLETARDNHLATVDVTHETDCAYRCYTVDNCRGFLLRCHANKKCNSYSCSLLSAVKRDEL